MKYDGITRRMRSRAPWRRGRHVALGSVAVLAVLAGGVAYATIPDAGTGLIHGCYSNTTGALRVIDPAHSSCAAGETSLNWNQRGLRWRGAWSATTAYAVGDGVVSSGSGYIAKVANTNSQPPSTNWSLLAARGAPGATGATGPQGPSGVTTMVHYNPSGPTNPGSWQFLGTAPVESFVDANTAAEVTGSVDIASNDGNGIFSELGVCYEPVGGDTVTNVALVAPEFQAPTDSFFAQTVSGVVGNLPTGGYLVGLCSQDETSNVLHGAASGTVIMAETASGVSTASTHSSTQSALKSQPASSKR
jgi:hypothetical protein